MSTKEQFATSGRGSGLFRLGNGPGATGGDIDVELDCFPAEVPTVSVEWRTSLESVPAEARQQTLSYIEGYLREYLALHQVGSFRVAVTNAGWFTDRHNEPERAAAIALHFAIIDAKLPPPMLYAAPDA